MTIEKLILTAEVFTTVPPAAEWEGISENPSQKTCQIGYHFFSFRVKGLKI